jgi:hypothetical protein
MPRRLWPRVNVLKSGRLHPSLPEKVKRILRETTLGEQKAQFKIEFEVSYDDKSIGAEYAAWLKAALRAGAEPPFGWRVALAISFIEGFGGRGTGKLIDEERQFLLDQIRSGARHLRRAGIPPGEADETAARWLLARRENIDDLDDVPAELVNWALEALKHPTRRKRTRKPPRSITIKKS